MENFFYNDKFYSSIEEYLIDVYEEHDDEELLKILNALSENYTLVVKESSLEPVFQLTPDWILDHIDEERYTEEGTEYDKIYNELKKVDFTDFNSKVPKLYYESRMNFKITKADLLEAVK